MPTNHKENPILQPERKSVKSHTCIHHVIRIAALLTFAAGIQSVHAQGTAFTYQGLLNSSNAPFSGSAEFQFVLWDSASGGNAAATNNPASLIATVTGGLFTVTLDFGVNPFDGSPRFLETGVRTAIGPFTTLTPRQPLTATPYALRALNLTSNGLAGTYGNAVTLNNAGNSLAGTFSGTVSGTVSGDGSGLANVNAATVGGLSATGFWQTDGNTGANPTNGAFIGTTDNLPLEFRANGTRILRLEPNVLAPNVVGGISLNFAGPGIGGATISGGGSASFAGFPRSNAVFESYGTIGGGLGNSVASGAFASTIAGGFLNDINTNSTYCAIGGGHHNNIGTNSTDSVISGGVDNIIAANTSYATIPGGEENTATNNAFAAGVRARANHVGAFVWGDSTFADIASTNANSVTMRAGGGYRLFSNTNATAGVSLAPSGTAWAVISDRNVKKDFAAVDSRVILEKLAVMPITQWHYRWEEAEATPHIGPMAQDFKAAFYPGTDDRSITTQEADGVELAAIQGLNAKLEEKDARIAAMEKELSEIKQTLAKLTNKKD